MSEYIAALLASPGLGPLVTCHNILPEADPIFANTARPWPNAMREVLARMGITNLYSHQAKAINALRSGRHVVTATPTASGKSLIYNLPVIDRHLHDPDARSLYLFPLKALAQDQLAAFSAMTAHWPAEARPTAAAYDGDTTPHFRRKIRENPPTVLLTNPEMLHLSLLPHHYLWSMLFAGLSLVVVDEVHTYRGLLGAHMSQLFRRLLRVAARYGARPTFAFCSATVGNPVELAEQLTGIAPMPVLESGAPHGKRHFVFLNPDDSPASTAIKLLRSALARNLRTIVYCQSRRMTELISLWAAEKSGAFTGRISAYRAGYLPEERRSIEKKLSNGDILAVISTSALELGIDIGTLDLCILVGYPGTVMATLQRGGRVGRSRQESAVLLIAGEDALDQYIVRHSEEFFSKPAEKAVLNPENPIILRRHLECAASELSLHPSREPDASWLRGVTADVVADLEHEGILLRSSDGMELIASRKRPHRHVALRGTGSTVTIEDEHGSLIGSVDAMRAMREAHPGAVYLHRGVHFEITRLDLPACRAVARKFRPPWFTRPRSIKDTTILSVEASRAVASITVQFGRLRVTDQVTGYEKRALGSQQLIGIVPLDMPPQVFETEGFWFLVPPHAQEHAEASFMHFMGAIHALEHAAIGILPLLVMTDRNDLGGISKPMHLETGRPTIFIYDGMPGGAGLTRAAFALAPELFARTRAVIAECPCDLGCPSCVHSPKCGSGNRPIDKAGALAVLDSMLDASHPAPEAAVVNIASNLPEHLDPPPQSSESVFFGTTGVTKRMNTVSSPALPEHFVVLDVETRYSAKDVGGWHLADRMGVSIAVLYDSRTDAFTAHEQDAIPDMMKVVKAAPLVIGFNVIRFDYAVLGPHAPGCDFRKLPTLDMLVRVQEQLSYRVSLDNLATATLGAAKSADGLLALQWWKEGKIDLITQYCTQDVALTRDIFLYGKEHGHLLFTNKAGQKVRVRATWSGQ